MNRHCAPSLTPSRGMIPLMNACQSRITYLHLTNIPLPGVRGQNAEKIATIFTAIYILGFTIVYNFYFILDAPSHQIERYHETQLCSNSGPCPEYPRCSMLLPISARTNSSKSDLAVVPIGSLITA